MAYNAASGYICCDSTIVSGLQRFICPNKIPFRPCGTARRHKEMKAEGWSNICLDGQGYDLCPQHAQEVYAKLGIGYKNNKQTEQGGSTMRKPQAGEIWEKADGSRVKIVCVWTPEAGRPKSVRFQALTGYLATRPPCAWEMDNFLGRHRAVTPALPKIEVKLTPPQVGEVYQRRVGEFILVLIERTSKHEAKYMYLNSGVEGEVVYLTDDTLLIVYNRVTL